jgi:hypothetical protein
MQSPFRAFCDIKPRKASLLDLSVFFVIQPMEAFLNATSVRECGEAVTYTDIQDSSTMANRAMRLNRFVDFKQPFVAGIEFQSEGI